MALIPGSILQDRYRIDRLLAQGGMGVVYAAWDLNLGVACAIKENRLVTDGGMQRFEREARLLASVRHSSLPAVVDYFTIPAQGQYLVMSYIAGDDLQRMMEKSGALPESQVVAWATDILLALDYLHQRSIIHRDIKPTNIKITPEGAAVLVDFGIAKDVDASASMSSAARGTPGFAPPEQYRGRTDARSDIYALGSTLYVILTGILPADALTRLLDPESYIPLSALSGSLSPALVKTIDKALAIDPRQRFANAAEMLAGLRGEYEFTETTALPATQGDIVVPAGRLPVTSIPKVAGDPLGTAVLSTKELAPTDSLKTIPLTADATVPPKVRPRLRPVEPAAPPQSKPDWLMRSALAALAVLVLMILCLLSRPIWVGALGGVAAPIASATAAQGQGGTPVDASAASTQEAANPETTQGFSIFGLFGGATYTPVSGDDPTATLGPTSPGSASGTPATISATVTASNTPPPGASLTPIYTASATATATATVTASNTPPPGASLTPTYTASATRSASATFTASATSTGTLKPSATATATATASNTPAASATRTATVPPTTTSTFTNTATNTATFTATATTPPTATPKPSLLLNPNNASVVTGASTTLSVSLSAAQGSDTAISLSSSNGGSVSVTGSVVIPAGSTSTTFSAQGQSVGSSTITASISGGNSITAQVTVNKADTTTSISANPNPVTVGQQISVSYGVNVNSPGGGSPSGSFTISMDGSTVCSGSAPSGQCSITASSTGGKTLSVTYSGDGNYNGSSNSTGLTVNPLGISLAPNNSCATTLNNIPLTVTISAAEASSTTVSISATGGVTVPASVTINAGSTSAGFNAASLLPASGTVTVTLPGGLGGASAAVNVKFALPLVGC